MDAKSPESLVIKYFNTNGENLIILMTNIIDIIP